MSIKSETFCVLPFIHQFIDTEGQKRLCCMSSGKHGEIGEFGGNKHKEIRQTLLNGERHHACVDCYEREDQKTFSYRQINNAKWTNKIPELDLSVDNKKIYDIDYRLSNHCNLACTMCQPSDSSTWAKLLKKNKLVNENDFDNFDFSNVLKAYIAGGEPLLIPKAKQFVERLDPNKTDLVINSNLTRLTDEWVDLIKRFKVKSVTASVEAYGELNEYIRWPMKWKTFEQNIWKLKNNDIPFNFNVCAMNINYFDLEQLMDFMHKFDPYTVSIAEIMSPCEYNFDYLRQKHRDRFIEFSKKMLRHPLSGKHTKLQIFFLSQTKPEHWPPAKNTHVEKQTIIDLLNTQEKLKGNSIQNIKCEFNKL
jgi:sulfatase maturation enzyme AslB (radical SAM superfamily)